MTCYYLYSSHFSFVKVTCKHYLYLFRVVNAKLQNFDKIIQKLYDSMGHSIKQICSFCHDISSRLLIIITTTTFVLMSLSRLAGVSNFCSSSLSTFFSIVRILSSQAFFAHSSHDFLDLPFFLFPVIPTSITSRIWELMSPRMT